MVQRLKKKVVKKVSPRISRTSKTAMLLEAKNVGFETTDWENLSKEQTTSRLYETIRHLNYFYDQKDSKAWAIEFAKQHLPKAVALRLESVSANYFGAVGRSCRMISSGAPLNKKHVFEKLTELSNQKEVSMFSDDTEEAIAAAPTKKSVSPAYRLKEKTSDFIAEIEDVLDMFNTSVFVDWENYSVYNELQKIVAAKSTAAAVVNYYKPLLLELEELVTKKTPELVEGYSHLTLSKRKQLLSIVRAIVSDAEKYIASKKATTSVRKTKVKSSDVIVAKMKYAKDSAEYKVSSVNPATVIGADKVLLFDTKARTLTLLKTNQASGMTVRGTTIYGFDSVEKKKLRKPDEALSLFLKAPKAKVDGLFNKLTTNATTGNGRCGETTIILKAFT